MNIFTNLSFLQGNQPDPHPFDEDDDRYSHGYGNRAARPGFSNHQIGRALDIDLDSDSRAWLGAHARAHGFYRTVKGEPWHWEFLGAPRRTARPAKPAPRRR